MAWYHQINLLRYTSGWAGKLAMFLLVVVLLAIPRLPALGRFVTADEPMWGSRSASFYYALSKGKFDETYRTGHPGVPTMWAGTIAYALKFPEYLMEGQVDIGDTKLLELYKRNNKKPIELLAISRLVVALACIFSVALGFIFAQRLFGTGIAAWMFSLIAFDPFHVSHSRYLHTNGLLASFMFLAILAWIYYLEKRSRLALLISAAGTALAILSITPGLLLIPVVLILTAWRALILSRKTGSWSGAGIDQNELKAVSRQYLLAILFWGGCVIIVILLIWPAMWVKPIESSSGILTYAASAAEGEIGAAHIVAAHDAESEPGNGYWYFYPLSIAMRSTPPMLIGLGLAAILLISYGRNRIPSLTQKCLFSLLFFCLFYLLIMSLGIKKFDRYSLPVFLPLEMVSAVGWFYAAEWISDLNHRKLKSFLMAGILGLVFCWQAAGTLREFPYYNTYYNPLMGGLRAAPQIMEVGWGEGLDLAAQYLGDRDDIRRKKVVTWYTLAFNWYAASLNYQAEMVDIGLSVPLEQYLEYDYLVIYINQLQRNNPPHLLAFLERLKPVHVVKIDGLAYAWVYDLHNPQQP